MVRLKGYKPAMSRPRQNPFQFHMVRLKELEVGFIGTCYYCFNSTWYD